MVDTVFQIYTDFLFYQLLQKGHGDMFNDPFKGFKQWKKKLHIFTHAVTMSGTLCSSVRAIFPFDIIGSYRTSFTISYSVYLLVINSFSFLFLEKSLFLHFLKDILAGYFSYSRCWRFLKMLLHCLPPWMTSFEKVSWFLCILALFFLAAFKIFCLSVVLNNLIYSVNLFMLIVFEVCWALRSVAL